MDDEFGADDALLEAMAASEHLQRPAPAPARPQPQPTRPAQAGKVQQPTPQRLDRPPPPNPNTTSAAPKVVQPTPQALPSRGAASGSTILVSPRQRGNPVLTSVRSVAWEYSDIPADYVLGQSTCALFLSLRYHRLHPEYIYTRIRGLQGRYRLRLLLAMVDVPNHEDPLRELSRASLVNGVTLILAWSAAEAARYLELYKTCEHAGFDAIRGHQATGYTDRLVDFVTVPRSLNKSDAVAIVANFGSVRNAVNADPDALALVDGWGGTKVKRWAAAVDEPFRVKKAKRTVSRTTGTQQTQMQTQTQRTQAGVSTQQQQQSQPSGSAAASKTGQFQLMGDLDDDDEEAMLAAAIEESRQMAEKQAPAQEQGSTSTSTSGQKDDGLSGGVAAALEKLRQGS